MSNELRRTALTRWGDPLFRLALLQTGNRAAADAATIAAFTHLDAPHDPELALYIALARFRARRWRMRRRHSLLPRALARIAPSDRLLLGLVLLRNTPGAHLTAIFNRQPAEIIARLEPIVVAALDEDFVQPADHLTPTQWLAYTLGFAPQHADHLRMCGVCRAAQAQWRAGLDRLRGLLHETVGKERLSAAALETIAMLPASSEIRAAPAIWWQQRRVWLAGLLASVGVALLLMIVPLSRPVVPAARIPAPAPQSARELVQQTLDRWAVSPATGARYLRVWAIDLPLRTARPVITDVWLAGGSAAHRVEVRADNTLVEWQIGDGSRALQYAADPAFTACRWNTDYSGYRFRFSGAALQYTASAEEQRAARDARLQQGAYGTGYVALLHALAADNLRSFGVQTEGGRALAVLQYSDQQTLPEQRVLLKIDPQTQQLYTVQVMSDDAQGQPRDLWRLERADEPSGDIPGDRPAWQTSEARERLIDPACPSLNTEYVASLRQVVALREPVFVPHTLPPGITGAAFMLPNANQTAADLSLDSAPNAVTTLLVGPGRWISLSIAPSLLSNIPGDSVTRGSWRVAMQEPSQLQAWRGTAFPTNTRLTPIQFWAAGWSREALLQVFDSLEPATLATWQQHAAQYIDPRPLSSTVTDALFAASAATRPQPDQTVHTLLQSELRAQPSQAEPGDPYYLSAAEQFPTRLSREQWLVRDTTGRTQVRDTTRLPDGQTYLALLSDGAQLTWYSRPNGQMWSNVPVRDEIAYLLNEPSSALITMLLASTEPISATTTDGTLTLEQRVPPAAVHDTQWRGPALVGSASLAELPDGTLAQRLALDRTTNAPQRFEVIQRTVAGIETPIARLEITVRDAFRAAPAAVDLTAPPAVPDDVLTFQWTEPMIARAAATARPDPAWRAETLSWTPEITRSLISNFSGVAEAAVTLDQLRQGSWDAFTTGNLWRQTQYEITAPLVYATPGAREPTTPVQTTQQIKLTLTQGPRQIMRYILRYGRTDATRWTYSEPILVQLAGQPRTAWLLVNERLDRAALVVEVDDLLLHIAAPLSYLRGPLLEQLPLLHKNNG